MKQLICLVLILSSLFSCVKETDYPVTFQFDHNSVTTPNITDYTLILSDTGLYISGTYNDGTLQILIPKIGGNPILVGEYTINANNGFSIIYTSSSTGISTKAASGVLNMSHVNSYVDFTFNAVLSSGIALENGVAKNLPFVTEENYYQNPLNPVPVIPGSGVDTITDGLYAEIQDVITPFYVPAANVSKTLTDSSVIYRAIDGQYWVDIELMKPISNLVGNSYDITQANQSMIKMQWRDFSVPAPNNTLDVQDGSFHVFSLDPLTGEIDFGFSGHLYNTAKTFANPIHVGYGKKLTI